MKINKQAGSRWRTIMVLAPLALLVVLAIAASGTISAGQAVYSQYVIHSAPPSSYGVSNQMLYVANGRASNVAMIDVGTMSIVDTVPVPNQPTPAGIHSWNPGLMNWEIHGAVPSKDRKSVYAVGALSAGSYDPVTGVFRLADYRMYQVDVATKTTTREIPLQGGPNSPVNPVGFCGLEYNLNDENSNEIVATNMNASNASLAGLLSDPVTHAPIDLSTVRGSGAAVETGGLAYEDIVSGTNTGNLNVNQNASLESSTCGIAWDASGTHAFAAQQFDFLVDKVDWNPATGTGTVAGELAPFAGQFLGHQAASDKANDRLYVTSSSGYIYVYAMSTGAEVASINIRALTNTGTNNIHGVEVAPGNPNVLYVTSRETPDAQDNMELVVDVTSLTAPKLIGSVNGLATGACGVYAIPNKADYYTAANPTHLGNQMLFVANGRASNVAVIDVGTMSIVDTVPVPNQPTPAGIHSWNPSLMNWEIHGAVPSKDRTQMYAVGALSAGSYDPVTGVFRLADYRMYEVNTATKTTTREIPLQGGPNSPVNPVGFCGLEYNLNDENSNEIVATNMNASNASLAGLLSDPVTHAPIDLSTVRGSGAAVETGGLAYEDIVSGTNTGNLNVNQNASLESSTCGIAWDASGTHAFAAQQFDFLVDKVDWNPATGTGTVAGELAPFAGQFLGHQAASDKANDRLYVTSSSGYIYVYAMSTGAEVASINIRSLAGSLSSNIHGVEVAPGNPNVLYVTSRETPDAQDNMELVVDVTSLTAPKMIGSVNGLATSACGVYAIANKAEYYGTKPALTLSKTGAAYWASIGDWEARKLSVNYSIGNGGSADAANVSIVGSNSTNGVSPVAGTLPMSAGNIAAGASTAVTLQYNIPLTTGSFMTSTYATAQNGAAVYTYPGPYPGP